jgi:hypothetical protein
MQRTFLKQDATHNSLLELALVESHQIPLQLDGVLGFVADPKFIS